MNAESNEVNKFQKRICSWAMSSALLIGALFIFAGEKAVGKGLLLGACLSTVNFLLMGKSLPIAVGQPRLKASLIGLGSILFRYAILAVPLVLSIKSASFNFVAVVIGIFAVQITALLDHIVIRPISSGK